EAPRPRRGARALDVASCLALAATMAFSYYVLASSFISRLLGTVALRVVVPGVNVHGTSLVYILASLAIGVAVHELAHAALATANGLRVKSMGVAVALILPLAFTEIDESDFERAGSLAGHSVLSAGVAANVTTVLLALAALSALSGPGVSIVSVDQGSLAERSGLAAGDVLLAVNGQPLNDPTILRSLMGNASVRSFVLTIMKDRGAVENLTVYKGAETALGVELVGVAPSAWLVSALGVRAAVELTLFLDWLGSVNLSLGIINALPLFITDGARALMRLLGSSRTAWLIINVVTLLLLASSLGV
ncbi:MAG: site-2 protease family protein, partial [Desulfurococcaceae archaeon]